MLVVPIIGAIGLILLKTAVVGRVLPDGARPPRRERCRSLKHLFGRARPEDIIVISDYGSFPSGHVANAATLATAAFILFPRLWVAIVGVAWVLLMALSRTCLHAHWLSDTIGGALIGVGVVLIVAGIFAPLLRRARADAAPPTRAPQPLSRLSA